jgi:sporulation protein YlmC with PRC-barrel domain
MAEFAMGAKVSCSDGFCGEVRRTILDPAARTVTHLVIQPGHHNAEGRLVPIELADATGGEIRLHCTLAEFERLEPAEEVDLAEGVDYGGGYGQAGAVQGYGNVGSMGVGGSASGMGIGMGLGHRTPLLVSHAVPLGETEVERHESVHAVDGEIGRVEGFAVDPADHQVTHILLQEGHLWGRKEVAIPVSAVASLDAGIRLNITKKQVEDLPPLGQGHP